MPQGILEQQLGRNPTSEEVAKVMGMELESYFRLLEEVHFLSVVSLDDAWVDEDGSPFGLLDVIEDKAIQLDAGGGQKYTVVNRETAEPAKPT